jgi:hypothetical protein
MFKIQKKIFIYTKLSHNDMFKLCKNIQSVFQYSFGITQKKMGRGGSCNFICKSLLNVINTLICNIIIVKSSAKYLK